MLIRRYNRQPYSLLPLFDSYLRRYDEPAGNPMAMDVVEREDAFVIRANLPGIDRKDVKVLMRDDHLVIEAAQSEQKETKTARALHAERYTGQYVRSVYLPQQCDRDAIKARMADGVLELTVPKVSETRKEISIN